ncbi:hypothetical protein [Nocardia tengchongensis]|uniref:hypothetical protein n=1 Tax=Nocardia tengchongensis TaxID=2055889 RepID=UPI00364F2CE3
MQLTPPGSGPRLLGLRLGLGVSLSGGLLRPRGAGVPGVRGAAGGGGPALGEGVVAVGHSGLDLGGPLLLTPCGGAAQFPGLAFTGTLTVLTIVYGIVVVAS